MTNDIPSKTGQFLNALAEGFRQTRIEILVFFLVLTVLLLLILSYFAARRVTGRRERERRSRVVLEHLLGKIELGSEEAALLGRLAAYLRPELSADALLMDHHVFDACARAMRKAEGASEGSLNALRLKIGFHITQPAEMPSSTVELPEGSAIILVSENGRRARGTLRAQGQGSMMVQLEQPVPALRQDARATAYFHNAGGIYSFSTRIEAVSGDSVRVSQSENVVRHQRRRYYRRKESLPVFVRPAAGSGAFMESILVDLGGGGASIRCPRRLLKQDDLMEISFSPVPESWSSRLAWSGSVQPAASSMRASNPSRKRSEAGS